MPAAAHISQGARFIVWHDQEPPGRRTNETSPQIIWADSTHEDIKDDRACSRVWCRFEPQGGAPFAAGVRRQLKGYGT